jgi:hypothetical protein
MTVLVAPEATEASAAPRRRAAWPTLVVAAAIAVVSCIAALGRWPAPVQTGLFVVAALATGWAAWTSVRRPSVVIAPLAVCLLALGNPLSLGGIASNVEAHAGIITVRTEGGFGLVFWKEYPGVAGWSAPSDPQPVQTVAFATQVQAAVRGVVTAMSDAYGLTWTAGQGRTGVESLPNGFGGLSMFDRVDSAQWRTTLDGSAAQRTALVAATRTAANALGLADEAGSADDIAAGTGTMTWQDPGGVLTLMLAGDAVTLQYSGGPFLRGTSLPGEYEQRMAGFAGLTPPTPLNMPDVPRR